MTNGTSDTVPELPFKKAYGRSLGLLPLHEAALKLAGMGLNKSQEKTRDLVAMLLAHGARAWRSGQPEVVIHLHVTKACKRSAMRMRIG